MQNILKNTLEVDVSKKPWVLLLVLVSYVFLSLFLFYFIGQAAIMPFYDFSMDKALEALRNPLSSEANKLPLLIFQGVTSIGGFIVAPVFFISRYLKIRLFDIMRLPDQPIHPILMSGVLVFCFIIVNSVLIEWNQNISLPEAFSWLEKWARKYEDSAEELTLYLTAFDSFWYYLIALIVIAVIPAIGEELLFRGLIQNFLHQSLKNAHAAIWLSALLFAAFHFQFYGLVPRMMLGVLFGYIYYWSGNLTLAMIGHFINNTLSLTIFYLSQTGIIEMKPEDLESSPPYYVILLFLAAGVFLIFLFRRYFQKENNE